MDEHTAQKEIRGDTEWREERDCRDAKKKA